MKRTWLLNFAVLAMLASSVSLGTRCASMTPLIVTGETLHALGEEFVACAAAMDAGLDAGRVSPQQYRDWAHFGEKFKGAYGPAVSLWKIARAANDAALESQAAAAVGHLADELGGFVAQSQVAAVAIDGGG